MCQFQCDSILNDLDIFHSPFFFALATEITVQFPSVALEHLILYELSIIQNTL